jgi:pimeloyl-ACP methyl ester carboxylesterase
MTHRLIENEDGWFLGVTALGDPVADRLVVLFPPTPGAGGFDPDPLLTGRWGVQLVTIDRPGYGASEPSAAAAALGLAGMADAVAHYVERSAQAADHISHPPFQGVSAIGWGEGGAWAATLAARHPDLVDRLALVGTPRPTSRGPYPGRPVSLAGLRIPDDDPNLRLPGVADRLHLMLDVAGQQGARGVQLDAAAIREADWAESVGRIEAETLLVCGERDPLAGARDGRWFERRIPRARLRTVPDTGLLAIVACWEEVLAHVAPQHGHVPEHLRDSGTPQIERDPRAWSAGAATGQDS